MRKQDSSWGRQRIPSHHRVVGRRLSLLSQRVHADPYATAEKGHEVSHCVPDQALHSRRPHPPHRSGQSPRSCTDRRGTGPLHLRWGHRTARRTLPVRKGVLQSTRPRPESKNVKSFYLCLFSPLFIRGAMGARRATSRPPMCPTARETHSVLHSS